MSINGGRPSFRQNGCFGGNNSRRGSKPRDMADHDLVNFIASLFRKPGARKTQGYNREGNKARDDNKAREDEKADRDKPESGKSA